MFRTEFGSGGWLVDTYSWPTKRRLKIISHDSNDVILKFYKVIISTKVTHFSKALIYRYNFRALKWVKHMSFPPLKFALPPYCYF
jgi:hypothetical protein